MRKDNIYLCIETIPKRYGEKYIYDISHLNTLISKINSSNIKINFDTSLFHFKKLNFSEFLENSKKIENIQISQKNFKNFKNISKNNRTWQDRRRARDRGWTTENHRQKSNT